MEIKNACKAGRTVEMGAQVPRFVNFAHRLETTPSAPVSNAFFADFQRFPLIFSAKIPPRPLKRKREKKAIRAARPVFPQRVNRHPGVP
jgi:hypothetical protein